MREKVEPGLWKKKQAFLGKNVATRNAEGGREEQSVWSKRVA